MKTALTREINGKTIIIGFSDPVIDPVETEKKILALNKPLIKDFKNKKNQLVKEQAVYFTPKNGEVFIEDSQYEKFMKKEIGEFGKLTLAGKVIPDYSGHFIYQYISGRWVILKLILGDKLPDDAVLEKDLTNEQKMEISKQAEADRITALSDIEKETEKQLAIGSVGVQAAQMRSVLKIQGEPNALKTARDWYNEQLIEIEKIYK